MKSKPIYILLAVLLASCLAACGKAPEETPAEPTPEPTPEAAIVVVEQLPVHSDTWEDILAEEVPPPEDTPGLISSTTGREVEAERVFRPVFVCYDNATGSRPLSGVANADIVYEAPALAGEGTDGTRLLALFSDVFPAQVGPVGMACADFSSVQREWGGMFVDEGYSVEEYFFTPEGAKGEFVDLEGLVSAQYTEEPPAADVRFLLSEGYTYADASPAIRFRLPFGGGRGERVEYAFDPEAGQYLRYQAAADGRVVGAAALLWNEESAALESVPLFVDSVIVQYVNAQNGALELIGSGKCDFFVNGVRVPGEWSRAAVTEPTVYSLSDGSIVTMESGHTWIALHPADLPAQVL